PTSRRGPGSGRSCVGRSDRCRRRSRRRGCQARARRRQQLPEELRRAARRARREGGRITSVNEASVNNLLDSMDLGRNRRLAENLVESAFALLADDPSLLDLKISSAALEEMREAFKMFAPFHDVPKVT